MVSRHSQRLGSLNIVETVIDKNTIRRVNIQRTEQAQVELRLGFADPELVRDKMLIDQQGQAQFCIYEFIPLWVI